MRRSIPRDLLSTSAAVALSQGEVLYDVALGHLRFGDGSTLGGKSAISSDHFAQNPITISPLANAGATQSSMHMLVHTVPANAALREFAIAQGMYSNTGYTQQLIAPGTVDKVLSYRSFWAAPGSSDGWVDNILFHHETDDPINTHGVELDYDMVSDNQYGTAAGGAGLSGGTLAGGGSFTGASAHGHVVTGLSTGTGTITSGYTVASGTNLFQRGFTTSVGCIQSGFEDDSAASAAFRSAGANADGLQTVAALYSGAAVLIGNSQSIQSLTAGGARRTLLKFDATDNLLLGTDGTTAATNINVASTILPLVDNTVQLGATGKRFTSVWAANGTIQTSQRDLKTDIGVISAEQSAAFFDVLEPIHFRWVVGGRRPITETQRQEVLVRVDEFEVLERIGRRFFPRTVRSPVYETQDVEVVTGHEDVPGARTHWGVAADNVKDAADAMGLDFGGYVKADDGTEAVRPDQLLAIALAEIKSLRARVAVLEGAI